MADSKITALTALTSADPANDMIPIVDVSDTPPASGNTKRISINNILAASGTATLASATITGALTVGTGANAAVLKASFLGGYSVFENSAGTGNPSITFNNDLDTGIRAPSANTLVFDAGGFEQYRIASSGVFTWSDGAGGTRMTLNSTGLGVGVSPSFKLDVQGSGIRLNSGSATGFALLRLGGTASDSFFGFAGNANDIVTGSSAGDTVIGSNKAGANLRFISGNGAINATLDASGNLLVGTTSNPNSSRAAVKTASVTSALSLNSVTGDTAQELFVINKFDSNSTTSQVFARFTNNNGAAGSGQINGNGANACAFGSFSDARLKENIVSLPSQLANILSLRPVEFDYKDGSGHQIGFVAQEIQEVYADTVAEQNGFLTVTGWSKTEARLVSAIKELAAKVQALEAKLA